ncbi:MAG: hypothetical protein JWM40_758 [Frankiales bacterium]|nr:hypothetical protein [Frankiales bacterium]
MPLLRRLALLLALEGVALVVVGVVYAVVTAGSSGDRLPAELAAGAAVITGLLLLVLARGADRGRGWSRSPAVVLNVFPFPLALSAIQGGGWWAALPMVLLAGSVLYLFATPELRLAFREGTD